MYTVEYNRSGITTHLNFHIALEGNPANLENARAAQPTSFITLATDHRLIYIYTYALYSLRAGNVTHSIPINPLFNFRSIISAGVLIARDVWYICIYTTGPLWDYVIKQTMELISTRERGEGEIFVQRTFHAVTVSYTMQSGEISRERER